MHVYTHTHTHTHIYICIKLNHFAGYQKLTQYCYINCISIKNKNKRFTWGGLFKWICHLWHILMWGHCIQLCRLYIAWECQPMGVNVGGQLEIVHSLTKLWTLVWGYICWEEGVPFSKIDTKAQYGLAQPHLRGFHFSQVSLLLPPLPSLYPNILWTLSQS